MAIITPEQLQSIYEDVALLQSQVAELQQKVTTLEELTTSQSNLISALELAVDKLQLKSIALNTNLNDLDIGRYHIPNTTICNSLINCPITDGATAYVDVLRAGGDYQIIQICRPCKKNDTTYYQRCYYSGDWGNWHTITN